MSYSDGYRCEYEFVSYNNCYIIQVKKIKERLQICPKRQKSNLFLIEVGVVLFRKIFAESRSICHLLQGEKARAVCDLCELFRAGGRLIIAPTLLPPNCCRICGIYRFVKKKKAPCGICRFPQAGVLRQDSLTRMRTTANFVCRVDSAQEL